MSNVHAKDRKPNDFQLILKARSLSIHTSNILSNHNVFDARIDPDEFKELGGQPVYNPKIHVIQMIDRAASDIYMSIYKANNVRVNSKSSYNRRLSHQNYALDKCVEMLALIDRARQEFHLRLKKYSYWCELTIEVKNLLSKWITSDAARYREYRR